MHSSQLSYNNGPVNIYNIHSRVSTSQPWQSARLSIETVNLCCPCSPPPLNPPLLLCSQRLAIFYQCCSWRNSSLLSRSPVGSIPRPQCTATLCQECPPLTTPLQACVTLIQVSSLVLRSLRRSTRAYETQKVSGLFNSIHVGRARALIKEIMKRSFGA